MARLEGSGYFIKRIIFQYCITGFAIALPLYGLGYLTGVPKVSCLLPDGTYQAALPSHACKRRSECKFTYSIDNWNQRYDLICEREALKDFSVSLMFWISSFGSLLVAAMIDSLGRKATIVIGSVVYLVCCPAIYLANDFQVKLIIMGVMASFDSNMTSSNSILVREISKEGSRFNSFIVNYGFLFYSLASVVIGLATLWIKSADVLWLGFTAIFFVGMIGNFFFYVESPMIYYRKKKLEPLLQALTRLGQGNEVPIQREELLNAIHNIEEAAENPQSIEDDSKGDLSKSLMDNENTLTMDSPGSVTTADLTPHGDNSPVIIPSVAPVKPANFWLVVFVLALHSIALNTLFYGLAISIDSSGFDSIQVNAILLGVSSMVGYYYASILEAFPRIKTITGVYGCIILSTLLNYLLGTYAGTGPIVKAARSLLSMVVVNMLLCGAFCNYYLYAGEALDVSRRGLGIGLATMCGRLIGSLSTYIKTYSINAGIDPIIGFTVPTIFAILAFRLVPETRPKPTKV
jgi:MFS family permease